MKENKITFEKEKVASMMRMGSKVLANLKIEQYEDLVKDKVVVRMEADLYKRTIEEKDVVFFMDRPTFFDWIFRRRKTKTVKVNISDVLNNPPMTDGDVTRFYNLKKLD